MESIVDILSVIYHNALTLEDVFGAVTPRRKPEEFNTLRDIAMEEHIERSQTLKTKSNT